MNELHAKSGYTYIIGCLLRPGALTFAMDLEHKYFPPETESNDMYNIFRLTYQDMPYYIIEIPWCSFGLAKQLATECGLNMVNGKPYASSTGSAPEFGLICNAESCFTLETINYETNTSEWQARLAEEFGSAGGIPPS